MRKVVGTSTKCAQGISNVSGRAGGPQPTYGHPRKKTSIPLRHQREPHSQQPLTIVLEHWDLHKQEHRQEWGVSQGSLMQQTE